MLDNLEEKDGTILRDGKEVKIYDQDEITQIVNNRLKNEKDKIRKEVEAENQETLDDLKTKHEATGLKVEELENKLKETGKTEEELADVKQQLQTAKAEALKAQNDYTKQLEAKNNEYETSESKRKALTVEKELTKHVSGIIGGPSEVALIIERKQFALDEDGKITIDEKTPEDYFEEWKKANPDRVKSNGTNVPGDGGSGEPTETAVDPLEAIRNRANTEGIPR